MGLGICDVLVVGGGPAGLRAAEIVSEAGLKTVLADQKPSVGRKFLVAGRGGLNVTHSEPVEKFPARYDDSTGRWKKLLADFSSEDLRTWVEDLGIQTFVGTSGRVFPSGKHSAPLLRRWVERLRMQGVSFRPRHTLSVFRRAEDGTLEIEFTTAKETVVVRARAMILALGGASWPQTGSDGAWTKLLAKAEVCVTPLTPSNCGYEVAWPESFLTEAEGMPLKNIVVSAGGESVAGELLITKYGVEGGAIYHLGRALRAMVSPEIKVDLKPTFSVEKLIAKIPHPYNPVPKLEIAIRSWRLNPTAHSLLLLHAPFESWEQLAGMAKALPISLRGPRPIEEAISSAGGVSWDELDDNLMIKRHPGVFCAGEMIDWDAPTGGYLLQGCFSTATRAARGAIQFFRR